MFAFKKNTAVFIFTEVPWKALGRKGPLEFSLLLQTSLISKLVKTCLNKTPISSISNKIPQSCLENNPSAHVFSLQASSFLYPTGISLIANLDHCLFSC